MLLGLEFPLVTSEKAKASNVPESAVAGSMYAADLLGAWMVALLVGTLLIPVWGLGKTMLFLLLLKIASLKRWIGFVKY